MFQFLDLSSFGLGARGLERTLASRLGSWCFAGLTAVVIGLSWVVVVVFCGVVEARPISGEAKLAILSRKRIENSSMQSLVVLSSVLICEAVLLARIPVVYGRLMCSRASF